MKKVKNNILGFIIGAIVFGSISVTIASQILATQVSYTNEKSLNNVTSVNGALTELYGLAEACQAASSSGIQYRGSAAEEVYLDPTGKETNCSESNYTSTESSGCFRFYVYAEDSEYKYAILDHNTTEKVSSCTNDNCFAKAQAQIKQDTSGWNPNYQARNISAYEIYKITENTNNETSWQMNGGNWFYFNKKNGNNGEGYGWLFDRTSGCTSFGCTTADNNVNGYWTNDAHDSSSAWRVDCNGLLDPTNVSNFNPGVRPIIKIAK